MLTNVATKRAINRRLPIISATLISAINEDEDDMAGKRKDRDVHRL
jgi:hypothetical protein